MDISELDDRYQGNTDTMLAYTNHMLDLQMRSLLIKKRIWAGRGFASVVFSDRIRSEPGVRDEDSFRNQLFEIAMHEAGHYLAVGQGQRSTKGSARTDP